MFSNKNKKSTFVLSKKGFTLIEMLIVIVIIGILAAAIFPKLSNARGRANDVARKAGLSQIAAGLVASQIDRGKFPPCTTGCTLVQISGDLLSAGMSSILTDPDASRQFSGIASQTISAGQYGYITIKKSGIDNNGFVLMAGTETEGGSNRSTQNGMITSSRTYDDISAKLCKTFTTIGPSTSGNCLYDKNQDQLRYIYIY